MFEHKINIVELRSQVMGEWVEPEIEIGTLADPITSLPRQKMLENNLEDVEKAIAGAYSLYMSGELEEIKLADRADMLLKFSEKLEDNAEKIAEQDAINTGIPFSYTKNVTSFLGVRVRSAVDEALTVGDVEILETNDNRTVKLLHKPLGPALIIAPWNAPTFTAVGKIASAIMAGCPVVLKPAEVSPSGCQLVAELLTETLRETKFPKATFQMLHGGVKVGSALSSDSRFEVISFTGGVESGRHVAVAAAKNITNVHLELGSNNPGIVLEDADIKKVAASIVQGMSRLNGQWCEAPDKILALESVYDELVEELCNQISTLKVGNSFDPAIDIGPVAYKKHQENILEEITRLESLGGRAYSTPNKPEYNGWFVMPTIVYGNDPMDATKELFGPVITVHKVANVAEALEYANGEGGGLTGFVFGENEKITLDIAAKIHAGEIKINGTFMADLADHSQQSFWGTSGVGGHGKRYGFLLFSGERVIGIDHVKAPL